MTSPRAWYGAHTDKLYALARIVLAFLYLCHGIQKHFPVWGGPMGSGSLLFMTAGAIEIVCGTAILIGFRVTWFAFIASGEMAVAYFLMHFPHGFWPIANHGELPVIFCFFFLYVSARGAGPWSVDHAIDATPRP